MTAPALGPAPRQPDTPADPASEPPGPRRVSRDLLGWASSLLVHGAAILALAALTLPPPPGLGLTSLVATPAETDRPDDSEPIELDNDLILEDTLAALAPAASTAPAELAPPGVVALPPAALADPTLLSTSAIAMPVAAELAGDAGVGVDGRASESRGALVAAKGGSRASEVAVALALKWIVEHQNPDGSWSLTHSAGACNGRCRNDARQGGRPISPEDAVRSGTGLALLPLLGAGETHKSGRYKRVVERGLGALLRLARVEDDTPGASWSDSGQMYSHGIAAIALTEAYGLTRDPELRVPAQAAIDYIAYAQDPESGGWRYRPKEIGDVSVTGWQIMALKSAALAELAVAPGVAAGARRFLDATQHNGGSRYAYMPPIPGQPDREPTRPLTAVGLLCRMYLGWERDDPRLERGVRWMIGKGPHQGNYYRNYYAAQALYHYTNGEGPLWREWNEPMREQLIEQQEQRGHERGSWWVEGPHNGRGGRLYTTSLATMTLEVYYRYLPLFQASAVETDFPD